MGEKKKSIFCSNYKTLTLPLVVCIQWETSLSAKKGSNSTFRKAMVSKESTYLTRWQTPTHRVLKCGEENAQGRDILVCPECLLLMLVEKFWKGSQGCNCWTGILVTLMVLAVATTQVCKGREWSWQTGMSYSRCKQRINTSAWLKHK